MTSSKALQAFMAESAGEDDTVDRCKFEFTLALEAQRRQADLSYKDIAEAIQRTPAYISKVFRGDTNLTIESMVKLAHAVGGTLTLGIAPAPRAKAPTTAARKVAKAAKPVRATAAPERR